MERLTDFSPLPWKGPYHGVAMANVPADYLLHVYYTCASLDERVHAYVVDNMAGLLQEVDSLNNITSATDDDTLY